MVGIFERIAPEKADRHAADPALPVGRQVIAEKQAGQGSGQHGDDGVVSLLAESMSYREVSKFG